MPNGAAYLPIWAGLTQAGGTVALINTNLRGDQLRHAIGCSGVRSLIISPEFAEHCTGALGQEESAIGCWIYGQAARKSAAFPLCKSCDLSGAPLDADEAPSVKLSDTALIIFTSGSTGLPKAARLSHYRLLEWSLWFSAIMSVSADDRLYDCLPMYHSTGGVAAVGGVLLGGGSVVIRDRFSATHFWEDVREQDCTIFLYIGELCRYLLQAAPLGETQAHHLRLCCGNGLRRDVWQPFQERFDIPQILEFYASTEGNVSLYNVEGRPGSIGRLPPLLAHRSPVLLVRTDLETGEIPRLNDGLCERCGPSQTGEALGRVDSTSEASPLHFGGYLDARATAAKLIHDVLTPGDTWFRTGDLMRQDEAGFFYFIDRVGDTFRWKGENVSAAEVADIICRCPGVTNAVVYGVLVEGNEGRAGMAAITISKTFEPDVLYSHVTCNLAAYARPLYVRICKSLDVTTTFKVTKSRLSAEGCDPAVMSDPLWHLNDFSRTYVRIGPTEVQAVPPASTVSVVPVTLRAASLSR